MAAWLDFVEQEVNNKITSPYFTRLVSTPLYLDTVQ